MAGFAHTGGETRTAFVTADDQGSTTVTTGQCPNIVLFFLPKCEQCLRPTLAGPRAGLTGFKVLKTTQSGYEGYLHDKYTLLPETKDRIMATSITTNWTCGIPPVQQIA